MSTDTPRLQESTGTVTGPHLGRDRDGELDHRYWRCERCGLESTDPRLREGCFRCRPSAARRAADGERGNATRGQRETDDRREGRDQYEACDQRENHDPSDEEDDARRA